MAWHHLRTPCPACGKLTQRKPPQVVLHIQRRGKHPPFFLLRCQYCGHLFTHARGPDFGRVLRDRGVPKDVAMAFKLDLLRRFVEVAVRPHTNEELAGAMEAIRSERERRVLLLDRRSVILDGVLYERAPPTA